MSPSLTNTILPLRPGTTLGASASAAVAKTSDGGRGITGRRRRSDALATAALSLAVVAALAYGVYRFTATREPTEHLRKVKFSRLTAVNKVLSDAVSPEGKLTAYFYLDDVHGGRPKLAVVPSAGGPSVRKLEFTPRGTPIMRWAGDDRALIFCNSQAGGTNLWRLPLDGAPPRPLTNFKSEEVWYFDASRDGRQLVCARGTTSSDVVMLSDAK